MSFEQGFLAASGPAVKITLPGDGVIFYTAGRVVWDFALGQFIFIAGPHDPIFGNVDNAARRVSAQGERASDLGGTSSVWPVLKVTRKGVLRAL